MRISDWSSGVCSSDLFNEAAGLPRYDVVETLQADDSVLFEGRLKRGPLDITWHEIPQNWVAQRWFEHRREFYNGPLKDLRSEERSVGKEWVSTCRPRRSQYHKKNNKNLNKKTN